MDNEQRDIPPVYGEYRVGKRVFVVSKAVEIGQTCDVPDFPHFDLPEYDEDGIPYAFACNEGCEFFDDGGRNPGARLCCDCKYLKGDPIGLCTCEEKRKGMDQ